MLYLSLTVLNVVLLDVGFTVPVVGFLVPDIRIMSRGATSIIGGKMRGAIRVETIFLLLLFFCSGVAGIAPVRASFDLSSVAYYDQVKQVLSLTSEQESMLQRQGFVSVEIPNGSDYYFDPSMRFEDFYFMKVYGNDLPVIMTTDSMLHLFHVVFDCSLRILENTTFYPMMLGLTQFAFSAAKGDYATVPHDGSVKYWAVRNSTVYFGVALSLLTNGSVALPPELSEDVAFYLNNVYASDLQFVPAGTWVLPMSPYVVDVAYDFTQFKIRGHYQGDAQLERYFRALMWYGQYPIYVPRNDEHYIWNAVHIDEAAIVHIRDIITSNPLYSHDWQLLYNVTSALIGESDSINLQNLEAALHKVFGDSAKYLDCVTTGRGLSALRQELSKPEYGQRILSQALVSETYLAGLPRYPIVFQFMGQRFVPDSYVFQSLCWDKVGLNSDGERRVLPKGLDLFAVLGSDRAYQLLTRDFDFANFTENLAELKQYFGNGSEEEWSSSSYTAWIHSLQSLVNVPYGDSYPAFMQNSAWQDEKLNTALGSWAQLRHDTILYAKQTYIPPTSCSYPEAFVEPNPAFYARMQTLSEQTIKAVNLLSPNDVPLDVNESLETLREASEKFEAISTKELNKEPLSQEEIDFVKQSVWMCGSGGPMGWYEDTLHSITNRASAVSILEAPGIADVATFPPGDLDYPPQILHVGVGKVNALVVLFPKTDGTLVAAVGPVFTYYEFALEGTTRLNDNEWKQMLTWNNRSEYLPEWSGDLYAFSAPIVPEFSNVIAIAAVMTLTITAIVFRTKVVRRRIKT
jgi:Protein of unknown function (DUF3160)